MVNLTRFGSMTVYLLPEQYGIVYECETKSGTPCFFEVKPLARDVSDEGLGQAIVDALHSLTVKPDKDIRRAFDRTAKAYPNWDKWSEKHHRIKIMYFEGEEKIQLDGRLAKVNQPIVSRLAVACTEAELGAHVRKKFSRMQARGKTTSRTGRVKTAKKVSK
jgi:hypothetical protein